MRARRSSRRHLLQSLLCQAALHIFPAQPEAVGSKFSLDPVRATKTIHEIKCILIFNCQDGSRGRERFD